MSLLNYLYNWISVDLVGISRIPELVSIENLLTPLLTILFFIAVIYAMWYLVGWVIKFISYAMPW